MASAATGKAMLRVLRYWAHAVAAIACLFLGVLTNAPVWSHGYGNGELQVRHPWARATPPAAKVAAAYLEIRNSGSMPDRVIGASTPAADRVELHVMTMTNGVMKMREMPDFEVPARQRLILQPGGSHLMIVGLRKPFAKGDRIPLTLHFQRAGELTIELEVQPADSRRAHH
jgi:periplasmic copper chaperone A